MRQWPLKILLAHPKAPFLEEKKLNFAADCTLLIDKDLTAKFEKEPVLIGCPMLEDPKRVFDKIKMIIEESKANEIVVQTMEVPCCHALHMMVDKAIESSGKRCPEVKKIIVRVSGEVEPYTGKIDESMLKAEAQAHGQDQGHITHACGCKNVRR